MLIHDIARWSSAKEGQFFERKSALDRSGAHPKQRKAAGNADVRRFFHVARNTAARVLADLVAGEWLASSGKRGLGARYLPGKRLLHQAPIAPETPESGAMAPESGAMKAEE